MIDVKNLTEEKMDEIVTTFASVDICDDVCLNLFIKNKWALHKTVEWAKSENIYVKRAAFIMMAGLAEEDKKAENFVFRVFTPIMIRECTDKRIHIKKAISRALRAMGKRNEDLHKVALKTAKEMLEIEDKTAKWIAKDVLGELEKEDVKYCDYPRESYRK